MAIMRAKGENAFGYTPIAEMNGAHADMLMDFGILRMHSGDVYFDDRKLEKAYLLVYGEAKLEYAGQSATISRKNCFDVSPIVLHVPQNVAVRVIGVGEDTEFNVLRTDNERDFPCKLYMPSDTPDEFRGKGLMQDSSTRIVRTVFNYDNAPYSNLVLGEVIGFPGKWSSYPPHHHPQPEIYYYKTMPSNGFGYAELGDDVVKVHNNDTVFIEPGKTHPHCTPPGYALWYLWAIRHLPSDPYITPTFVPEHLWVQEPDAVYWPEKEAK